MRIASSKTLCVSMEKIACSKTSAALLAEKNQGFHPQLVLLVSEAGGFISGEKKQPNLLK